MDISWSDTDIIDADGHLTPAADTLLHHSTYDERVAIVTMLGARATAPARRRLVAELLNSSPPPSPSSAGSSDGVTLVATVSYLEEDYRLLVLDVGDASLPAVGALCMLSSLVVSACDSPAAIANALPAFPPFQETLELMQRDASPAQFFDAIPFMLTMDFTRDASLREPSRPPTAQDLARLKTLGVRSVHDLPSSSPHLLTQHATVKQLYGSEMTVEVLVSLLRSVERDALSAQQPDLASAWDEFVERKCKAVAEEGMATYVDCIPSSLAQDSEPIEMDVLEKLHDDLWRLAMDVFDNSTSTLQAPSRCAVRTQLKADLRQRFTEEKAALHRHSHEYCQRIRTQLWRDLYADIQEALPDQQGEDSNPSSSSSSRLFQAALAAVRAFDAAYMDRARGPVKLDVLLEFHRQEAVDVFERLERVARDAMTEAHLCDLRQQLESDFEEKKAALVERFKQEEAQLRLGMAKEMEMVQKLHQAKHSRTKIDESEGKRLREEVAELKAANATLLSKQVTLIHALEDTQQHKTSLEVKARDLEDAVRQERVNRAELVDTLAATIKSSEDKERSLCDRITALEIEVSEKTSRTEQGLVELRLQLRKTGEEKEELQKKLHDFFLRVTALPPALQQHLFCTDAAEGDVQPVGFADALSSYMS